MLHRRHRLFLRRAARTLTVQRVQVTWSVGSNRRTVPSAIGGLTCAKNNCFNGFLARQSTGGVGVVFPSSTSAPIARAISSTSRRGETRV